MNSKLSKGFTLIELLVVIAIISLLSSVVLAAVNDARDKAKARAFREELMQLVTALELYRADHNDYPLEPGDFYIRGWGTGEAGGDPNILGEASDGPNSSGGVTIFNEALAPYIEKLPTPPARENNSWIYSVTPALAHSCENNQTMPPYVIHIPSDQEGFEDWSYLVAPDPDDNNQAGDVDFGMKCFSIQ
jgi:prepilin-type N-terminal cleavage/methylation domain-containing protein